MRPAPRLTEEERNLLIAAFPGRREGTFEAWSEAARLVEWYPGTAEDFMVGAIESEMESWK